jgi:hypothetical protein
MFMASAQGGATFKAIRSDKGHKKLSAAPTDTEWFCRFMTGICSRIGERCRQDAAISIALMLEFQKRLEAKWQDAVIKNDMGLMRETAEDGAFFLFTYCGSLRGYETTKISSRILVRILFLLRRPMKQRRKDTSSPPCFTTFRRAIQGTVARNPKMNH